LQYFDSQDQYQPKGRQKPDKALGNRRVLGASAHLGPC